MTMPGELEVETKTTLAHQQGQKDQMASTTEEEAEVVAEAAVEEIDHKEAMLASNAEKVVTLPENAQIQEWTANPKASEEVVEVEVPRHATTARVKVTLPKNALNQEEKEMTVVETHTRGRGEMMEVSSREWAMSLTGMPTKELMLTMAGVIKEVITVKFLLKVVVGATTKKPLSNKKMETGATPRANLKATTKAAGTESSLHQVNKLL